MADREPLDERLDRFADSVRRRELERIIAALAPDQGTPSHGTYSALAMLVVDASLEGDESALDGALHALQRTWAKYHGADHITDVELRGRVLAFIDVVRWALERSLPLELLTNLERDTHAHRFLSALAGEPGRSNRSLAGQLAIDDTAVSRLGRRLAEAGLARKRRVGRTNEWTITPRGVEALDVLENGGVARYQRPNRQLLGA
jgi:DNA-binding transcriptional ArsR family regulator